MNRLLDPKSLIGKTVLFITSETGEPSTGLFRIESVEGVGNIELADLVEGGNVFTDYQRFFDVEVYLLEDSEIDVMYRLLESLPVNAAIVY